MLVTLRIKVFWHCLDQSCPAHCHIITVSQVHLGHVSHTTQSNSAAMIEEKRAKTQSRLKTGSMLLLLLRRYRENHPRIGIMSFLNHRLQWIWIMPDKHWITVVIIGVAFWCFPTFNTDYFPFTQHFQATAFGYLHHINCGKYWNLTQRKVLGCFFLVLLFCTIFMQNLVCQCKG